MRTKVVKNRTARISEEAKKQFGNNNVLGFDLENIPDSTQFSNADIERRFSFYYCWVFCCWLIIGICIGVLLGYVIIYYGRV